MCYTAKDSLNAYVINFISSILLYKYSNSNDMKILALFLLFVGQMQLFDYLFWVNLKCNKTNKLVTKLAIIFNHLQPIVLFLLINYYGYNQSSFSKTIITLYTIFMIYYTVKLWPDDNCTIKDSVCCSLPYNPSDNKQVIKWQWNSQKYKKIMYILFLISLVSLSLDLKKDNNLIIFITIGLFFISFKIPVLSKSNGRLWCYMASFVPLVLLIKEKLF
jgi:hypothetical protein